MRRLPLLCLLLAACTPDGTTPPTSTTELVDAPPEIVHHEVIAEPTVPLTRTVEVTVAPAGALTVTATAADGHEVVVSSPPAESHRVTLLGLRADQAHDLSIVATNDLGEDAVDDGFTLDPLPENLPEIVVLSSTPDRTPGVYLMPLTNDDRSGTWAAVIDGEGRILWLYDSDGSRFHEVLSTDFGIRGIAGSSIVEVGWDGVERQRFSPNSVLGELAAFHHEVFQDADGRIVTLLEREDTADDVPTDYDDPTPRGPTAIGFDEVVTFEPDGSDPQRWEVTSLFDTSRIGWDSLRDLGAGRLDWGRANSVSVDAARDDWIVSVRNQDTVAAIDRATGELQWLLANPDNWTPELDALRLQPDGPVEWQYHQHAAKVLDGDRLMLFDNGNVRTTPLTGDPKPGEDEHYSRLVCYDIDPEAGTVSEAWSWQPDPRLYSASQGDIDELSSGHVLADFAYIRREDGIANEDLGFGFARSRIVEVDPATGDVHFELEIREEQVGVDFAWFAYRVEHMAVFPPE